MKIIGHHFCVNECCSRSHQRSNKNETLLYHWNLFLKRLFHLLQCGPSYSWKICPICVQPLYEDHCSSLLCTWMLFTFLSSSNKNETLLYHRNLFLKRLFHLLQCGTSYSWKIQNMLSCYLMLCVTTSAAGKVRKEGIFGSLSTHWAVVIHLTSSYLNILTSWYFSCIRVSTHLPCQHVILFLQRQHMSTDFSCHFLIKVQPAKCFFRFSGHLTSVLYSRDKTWIYLLCVPIKQNFSCPL